jgi:type I restriction-modification system DNA methylase subunit
MSLPANPPFNDSDWFRKHDDVRCFSLSASNGERAGVRCRDPLTPPKGNANFAWVQHFIHHLAPGGAGTAGGMAAFSAKVAPLYAQITANLHQSRTLATLRDTLLPKLLSGELSVASLDSGLEAVR